MMRSSELAPLDLLWLRSVLHDLDVPLRLLAAISDALNSETTEAEHRATMLTQLPGAIHRMTTRIHNLADVVRDPATLDRPEAYLVYDLAQLAQRSLPYLQHVARLRAAAGDAVQVEVLALDRVPVRMQPVVFERIIENLVVNSAETEARNILIVVSCVDDGASVVVLDDGPGFHPLLLAGPQPGTSLKACGRGIGLAGVAVNVVQFGGTLELGNLEDGTGARVQICFPLAVLGELERDEQELRQMFVQRVLG